MSSVEPGFRDKVNAIVAQIPYGRVMTYGQIAAMAGNARAARIVGGVAHYGDPNLPWHRVVNRNGGLAAGFPGGRKIHKILLEDENIPVNDEYFIEKFDEILWSERL